MEGWSFLTLESSKETRVPRDRTGTVSLLSANVAQTIPTFVPEIQRAAWHRSLWLVYKATMSGHRSRVDRIDPKRARGSHRTMNALHLMCEPNQTSTRVKCYLMSLERRGTTNNSVGGNARTRSTVARARVDIVWLHSQVVNRVRV